MKCIKDTDGKVRRVSDLLAEECVKTGEYEYCGKVEWKKYTRKKSAILV